MSPTNNSFRRSLTSLLLCLLGLASIVSCGIEAIGPVDFKRKVIAKKEAFVLFYSPDCHHCHDLMNLMRPLAQVSQPQSVKVLKINCKAHPEYIMKYDLKYFPSLAYFNRGEFESIMPSDKAYSAADVTQWMISKSDSLHDSQKGFSKLSHMKSSERELTNELINNQGAEKQHPMSVVQYGTLLATALSGDDSFAS